MIEIINGRIFIEGKETTNPELIGYALIDFAESSQEDNFKLTLKDSDVFVQKCNCFENLAS